MTQDLKKLFPQSTSPDRYADLLVQVFTRKGNSHLLYIHIEVQGRKEKHFAKRLFSYAYRIFDRMGELPASLILLTDTDRNYKPNVYEVTGTGRNLRVEFQNNELI